MFLPCVLLVVIVVGGSQGKFDSIIRKKMKRKQCLAFMNKGYHVTSFKFDKKYQNHTQGLNQTESGRETIVHL